MVKITDLPGAKEALEEMKLLLGVIIIVWMFFVQWQINEHFKILVKIVATLEAK